MRGTENAYVSGREVGMSMRIASNRFQRDQRGPEAHLHELTFFLVVRSLSFYSDELVPLALPFLVQQTLRYPREKIGGVCCLLCTRRG